MGSLYLLQMTAERKRCVVYISMQWSHILLISTSILIKVGQLAMHKSSNQRMKTFQKVNALGLNERREGSHPFLNISHPSIT